MNWFFQKARYKAGLFAKWPKKTDYVDTNLEGHLSRPGVVIQALAAKSNGIFA